MSCSLWLIVLISTGSPSLAKDQFSNTLRDADTIVHLRRAVWFMRRSWLPIKLGSDRTPFDFTHGLGPDHVRRISDFVTKQTPQKNDRQNATDRLVIAARALALSADSKDNRAGFNAAANQLLQSVATPKLVDFAHKGAVQKPSLPDNQAATALRDLSDVFGQADLRWFVLSGTFLGLVRENGFLAHDYDIDVGMMGDEVDQNRVVACVKAAKTFVLQKVSTQDPFVGADITAPRRMLVKLIHKSGMPVDIFFHYATPDGRVVHGSDLHHWFNSPFELSDYILEGVKVLGPADADAYLTENYGDWRTPVTEFNCTTDTPNLAIVRHPIAIAMFLHRLSYAYAHKDPDGPRLAEELVREGILVRDADTLTIAPSDRLWA